MCSIFKFHYDDKSSIVKLENLTIEDITNDKRSIFIPKKSFIDKKYKIDNDIYMVINDSFYTLGRKLSKKNFDCILIRHKNVKIFIIPSKSYVFWNNQSIEPIHYDIISSKDHDSLLSKLNS